MESGRDMINGYEFHVGKVFERECPMDGGVKTSLKVQYSVDFICELPRLRKHPGSALHETTTPLI